ncbi:hypothetical protein M2281_003810 [Mesorhizobium soli]|nr:hypothetical protein [Mesorhizobium soli]
MPSSATPVASCLIFLTAFGASYSTQGPKEPLRGSRQQPHDRKSAETGDGGTTHLWALRMNLGSENAFGAGWLSI